MTGPRYHGRAAFDPAILASIAAVLQSAAGTTDCATSIAGLLAAGGSEAEVSRYLRLEEERLLGAAAPNYGVDIVPEAVLHGLHHYLTARLWTHHDL
ncbi:MAG TPA: hypothetical protein VFA43_10810 [Gemmatimonadaceae bacterium]|nr:hypothetical protein [Gemmatimonadaceae bacterium]